MNGPTTDRYAHLWHMEIAVDNSSGLVYDLIEVDHLDDDVDEFGSRYVPPKTETFPGNRVIHGRLRALQPVRAETPHAC